MSQSKHLEEIPKHNGVLSEKREKALLQFLKETIRKTSTNIIYITFPVKCSDALRWFYKQKSKYASRFYWEVPSQSSSVAALGTVRKLSFAGHNRFRSVESSIQEIETEISSFSFSEQNEGKSPRWVGGFSFSPEIESSFWNGFQPANFILPELALMKDFEQATGCISMEVGDDKTPYELLTEINQRMLLFAPEYFDNGHSLASNGKALSFKAFDETTNNEFRQWSQAIQDAKDKIDDGELEKVVLSRMKRFSLDGTEKPVNSLASLRQQYPKGCTFLIKHEQSDPFLGCSPELLISTTDHSVETEALAGSIARGKNEQEDDKLAKKLLASSKDQMEHDFVVKSICENIAPFLASCEVPKEPAIKKLPNVQHLYTPIKGWMKENTTSLQIVEELHPTPAVGGTSKMAALSFIRNYEPFERGWFGAPVGWMTASGRSEFYVAIRSGLIAGECALLFAGCGIVADSDPEMEWKEANLKFKPMLRALKDE